VRPSDLREKKTKASAGRDLVEGWEGEVLARSKLAHLSDLLVTTAEIRASAGFNEKTYVGVGWHRHRSMYCISFGILNYPNRAFFFFS
jgi:hypothetical protein